MDNQHESRPRERNVLRPVSASLLRRLGHWQGYSESLGLLSGNAHAGACPGFGGNFSCAIYICVVRHFHGPPHRDAGRNHLPDLPYFLTVDVYMRAAIGEFWALAFLPLSFFFIERMAAGSRRAMPGLAVAFALVILSHLFTAVLLAPVLLAYAVWRVARRRRVLTVCQVLAALVLATGLAGVYALPFLFHRQFFHPENFLLRRAATLIRSARCSPTMRTFSKHVAGPGGSTWSWRRGSLRWLPPRTSASSDSARAGNGSGFV